MALHWQFIFIVLVLEAVLTLALASALVPPALKKVLIGWSADASVQKAAKIYFVVVSILCAETVLEILFSKPPAASKGEEAHEEFHHYESDLLKDHRNALISGAAALLLIVLEKLCSQLDENMKMCSSLEALKKQASGVSNEYMRLLKEQPVIDSKNMDSSSIDSLAKENRDLKDKVKELIKTTEKSQQEVEVIKKQATNQTDSYIQLAEENKSLRNKLEDYNMLLGDKQKKNA